MEIAKIIEIKGTGMPKPEDNQNTDLIVPARFLKEVTFKNMGNYAFIDERYDKNGEEIPNHPFNLYDSIYKDAKILVVGENFGCGSSREHAPQALYRFGIKAIVGVSFAEIFEGNCGSIGLVPVTTERGNIERLVNTIIKDPTTMISINLEDNVLTYDNKKIDISMTKKGMRKSLINGTWNTLPFLWKNNDKTLELASQLPYVNNYK